MYIFSFLKALFKPSKVLTSIYILLNTAMVFGLFYLFKIFSFGTTLDGIYNGLIGLGINFVCLLIALSPIGECCMRFLNGIKIMPYNAETERLYETFNNVYAKALSVNPKLSRKIKLYYKDELNVNAYALGHRTVCMTVGSTQLSTQQIEGLLAHEFGHISNADSDLLLGIFVSNIILSVFMFIVKLLAMLFSLVLAGLTRSDAGPAIINFLLITVVMTVFAIWTRLGMLMLNATSRADEYRADNFAVQCGNGIQLAEALSTIDPSTTKSPALAMLMSTHPDTVVRIERINAALVQRDGVASVEDGLN